MLALLGRRRGACKRLISSAGDNRRAIRAPEPLKLTFDSRRSPASADTIWQEQLAAAERWTDSAND